MKNKILIFLIAILEFKEPDANGVVKRKLIEIISDNRFERAMIDALSRIKY